jgi:hypothetical protein
MQRQLQVSLEAHGRYMVSLMGSELASSYGMDSAVHVSKISSAALPGQTRAAATSAPAALTVSTPAAHSREQHQPQHQPPQQQNPQHRQPQHEQHAYDAFTFDEPDRGDLKSASPQHGTGVAEWPASQHQHRGFGDMDPEWQISGQQQRAIHLGAVPRWPEVREQPGELGGEEQDWPFGTQTPRDGPLSPGQAGGERSSGNDDVGDGTDDGDLLLHLHDDADPLDFPAVI